MTMAERLEIHREIEEANKARENEVAVLLTEKEIGLLMYAIEGYAAHRMRLAYEGRSDKTKAKALNDDITKLDSKLYQIILKIHREE